MSLTNGTTPTGLKKKDLAPLDVVALLEACAQHHVLSLSWQGLHVSFSKPGDREGNSSPGVVTPPPLTDEQHKENTARSLEQDEVLHFEDRMAHLIVEDPVRFEEEINGEELDDADDEPSDDQ